MAETEKTWKRSGIERVLGQSIGVDPEQCGLLLLAGPVGAGKTYSSMSHIADQLIAFGSKCRRFVFVTNVKRNLPVDELLHILDERGYPELAAYVVKLDSNLGMFQSNINAAKSVMPSAPFSYWKRGPKKPGSNERTVIKAEFDIRNLPELQEAERLQRILDETRSLPLHVGAARRKAIEGAEEEAEKAESKLRRCISSIFASICMLDEGGYRLMTRQEKRELVEKSAWWEWLRVLYPSVLTHKKRVLFMSVSKLLVKKLSHHRAVGKHLGKRLAKGLGRDHRRVRAIEGRHQRFSDSRKRWQNGRHGKHVPHAYGPCARGSPDRRQGRRRRCGFHERTVP